jgi:hypothetical protein
MGLNDRPAVDTVRTYHIDTVSVFDRQNGSEVPKPHLKGI